MDEFDVALTKWGAQSRLGIVMPAPLGRALDDAGYNRASLTLVREGILVRPYADDGPRGNRKRKNITLPDWGTA